MIDCGHNTSSGWRPGTHLQKQGITELGMLAVTNYDEDHVSGLPNLLENVHVGWLWRNTTVTPETLKTLKSEDGMGAGIDALTDMAKRFVPVPGDTRSFDISGVERRAFINRYPDFDDENNLSMVIHLKINGIGFLFPGDLETAGWEALLASNQEFRDAVGNTHVLIASHHGRENGICKDIFDVHGCTPLFVVISDKGYMYDTQKTVQYYASKAFGAMFRNETRKVLTTRKDGTITFHFEPSAWWAK